MVCDIYEYGEIPVDFDKCIIVPIPKKVNANKHEQYRTLSLESHTSKMLTTITIRQMEEDIEGMLMDDHFGFRKGSRTREATLA
jgi:hypothetical protein